MDAEQRAELRRRTSELLGDIAAQGDSEQARLGEIVDRFGLRAFGILIVLATLPAFLPTPVGAGALAAPLIGVVGLQMLIGLEHPWLPRWLREKGVRREAIGRFVTRFGPWLRKLERLCRPRWVGLFGPWPTRLTGLLAILQAVVLALPIPLTNYPVAIVLLLIGVALIEDDGVALALGWLLIALSALGLGLASEALIGLIGSWFGS
jgi:hypothetical protein